MSNTAICISSFCILGGLFVTFIAYSCCVSAGRYDEAQEQRAEELASGKMEEDDDEWTVEA